MTFRIEALIGLSICVSIFFAYAWYLRIKRRPIKHLMDIHIIDQNILGHLYNNSKETMKWFRFIKDLVDKNTLPGNGQITLAGLTELIGFKFRPGHAIQSITISGELGYAQMAPIVKNCMELFTYRQNGKEVTFGVKDFKEKANERLKSHREYYKDNHENSPPILALIDNLQKFVDQLTPEYLLGHFTTRAMSTAEFLNRFVSDRWLFLKETVAHCLASDIPCCRLVCEIGNSILPKKYHLAFDFDAEHLDEDAVWHLVFGKVLHGQVKRIAFLTLESKVHKLLELFTAMVCGLKYHGLDLLTDRLDGGPGSLLLVQTDSAKVPNEVLHRNVATFVEVSKKFTIP